MPIDYTVLKKELQKPEYADALAAGSDNVILDILNAPGVLDVPLTTLDVHQFRKAVDFDEFSKLSPSAQTYLTFISSGPDVDVTNPNLAKLFPPGSITSNAIQELLTRKGSIAETLFGVGVVVPPDAVAIAFTAERQADFEARQAVDLPAKLQEILAQPVPVNALPGDILQLEAQKAEAQASLDLLAQGGVIQDGKVVQAPVDIGPVGPPIKVPPVQPAPVQGVK